MSPVITIAWRDIRSYFASPKGAAIFFFFLGFMSLFFYLFVMTYMEYAQRASSMGGEGVSLEQLIRAFFDNIYFILLLVVPAVTMSSFSEERRNQTLRLLQTSPVTALQIVLGKFFASVLVLAFVLACSAVYPLFIKVYGNPDAGIIWTSYLGVLLLMSAQVAFGLWVSSMTSNQFLSFLFTMFGLFLLLILNYYAPNMASGGIWESVVKYIAAKEHLDSFFKGILTVADVTYFACFIAVFLFFTNIVLDSQRWR